MGEEKCAAKMRQISIGADEDGKSDPKDKVEEWSGNGSTGWSYKYHKTDCQPGRETPAGGWHCKYKTAASK